MKIIILALILSTSALFLHGQTKRQDVYYLADTVNSTPSNNILTITKEYPFYEYLFHCRCIKANNAFYVGFAFNIETNKKETFPELPKHKYLSWKELENMLYERQRDFDSFYLLHIVEVLPDGRFMKNEVKLLLPKREVTH